MSQWVFMTTLTHWQWLILNKASQPAKIGLTSSRGGYRPLHNFSPKVWLVSVNTSLWPFSKCPTKRGELRPSYLTGPVVLKRGPKIIRLERPLEHAFLTSGLLRFGEELSGAPFSLLILKNILKTAHPRWVAEVYSFHSRLAQVFKLSRSRRRRLKVRSPRHPWFGGARMIVSSICSRDPFLLTQWAKKRMKRMRLFAHKRFLRLVGSFLKSYVSLKPSVTTVLGFNLVTTGKISVTGNAMSRTMLSRFGKASINNLSYRASSSFALIKTKTGCLGLNLVFYY